MGELDGVKLLVAPHSLVHVSWEPPLDGSYKANFDATFNAESFQSGSWVVIRDSRGLVLASKMTLHSNVQTAFVMEASHVLNQ